MTIVSWFVGLKVPQIPLKALREYFKTMPSLLICQTSSPMKHLLPACTSLSSSVGSFSSGIKHAQVTPARSGCENPSSLHCCFPSFPQVCVFSFFLPPSTLAAPPITTLLEPIWRKSPIFMAKPRGLVHTCWASLPRWLSPVSGPPNPPSPVPSPSLPIAIRGASASSSSLEMSLLPRLFVQPSLLSNAHRPFGIPKEYWGPSCQKNTLKQMFA